ncbi:MAG: tape measure protein [Ruminiclostridium sp.]
MASIANAIQITNGTAKTFDSINKSINVVINNFKKLNVESSSAINTSSISAAAAKLSNIEKSFNNIKSAISATTGKMKTFNSTITSQVSASTTKLSKMTNSFNSIKSEISAATGKMKTFNSTITSGVSTTAKLSKMTNSFNNTKSQKSETAGKKKTFASSFQEGVAGVSGFTEKVKGIASSVWPAVKAGMALSDSFARQNTNLALVNDGTQSQAALQNKVFAAAQNSRSSYEGTAATVTKLGGMSKDDFKTNDEAIYFTELMNKAFSGVDASSAASGIEQITQAMVSGKLQGEDLMSVMEKAPMLAESISKYTGKSQEELTSGDGVSDDVIKNSLFSSASDINTAFNDIPATFEQLGIKLKNSILQAVGPILLAVSEGAAWISSNWSTLEPIFWGLVAAVAAFTVGLGILKVVTFLLALEQMGLNVALIACPLILIAVLIGVIIGYIVKWVQSVGGIQVAWLIVVNALLTAWDWLKIGFFTGVYFVMDLFDKLKLGISSASVGIQNFMGDMAVKVLTILQDMVNGAIGLINVFIGALNNIPGVKINAISEVDFGDTAKLQNEAAKKARNAELEDYRTEVESNIANRAVKIEQMKTDARAATAERQNGIAAAQADAAARAKTGETKKAGGSTASAANSYSNNQALQNNIANTAANTGAMKNSMDVSEEDLKYMKDIAEQEVINRFTTSEIKVDMTNNNNINSNLDLDGVVAYMEKQVNESLMVSAEGAHN